MADKVGDIYVSLSLKNQSFKKNWNDSEQLMMRKSQSMVASAARLSVGLTAPLTLIGRASINEFRKFDKAMTRSTAIMEGMTDKIRASMENQARVMSLTGAKSATELAKSYYFLASAGLDANESIGTLPTTLKFATAGVMELDKSVSLLVTSQSALGLSSDNTTVRMKNLERVASVLLKANTLADASTEQFAQALANKAAPSLRLVNKEIEEGVAVLAVYAKQAIRGAKAGTFLNIALRELRVKAVKNKEEFEKLGINVFDSSGKMHHMADIVQDLEKNFGHLSTEMKTAALLQTGFSQRSIFAIQSLIGFSRTIRDNEKALHGLGGILDKLSSNQLKSFDNQIKILGHRFDYIQKEIGEEFVPVVGNMNDAMKTAIVLWKKLDKETKTFIVTAGTVGAVLGPLMATIGGVGILAIHFKAAIAMLGLLIAKLALFGATIGVIVSVFDYFFSNFRGERFDQLMLDIGTAWELMVLDMSEIILLFLNDMDRSWIKIKTGAEEMTAPLVQSISSIFNSIVDESGAAWMSLKQLIDKNPFESKEYAQKNSVYARNKLIDMDVHSDFGKDDSWSEISTSLKDQGKTGAEYKRAMRAVRDYQKSLQNEARIHAEGLEVIEKERIDRISKLKALSYHDEAIKLSIHNNRMKILNKDLEDSKEFGGRKEAVEYEEHIANRIIQLQKGIKDFSSYTEAEWKKLLAGEAIKEKKKTKMSMDHLKGVEEATERSTKLQGEYYDNLHKGMEEGFTGAWENMFNAMMDGTATLQDAFQALGMELLKIIAQQALIKPLSASFGGGGADGVMGIVGAVGGMFSGFSAPTAPAMNSGLNSTDFFGASSAPAMNSGFSSSEFFADGGIFSGGFASSVSPVVSQAAPAMTKASPTMNFIAPAVSTSLFADGGAFGAGSVLTSPTPFSMGGGKLGIAGEAGPEAALPLERMANGKLGVSTNGGGGSTTINNFNITTPDADSFKRSQRQIMSKMK